MTSGYSKTPLVKKLGLKSGYKVLLHNVPKYYFKLLGELPQDITYLNTPNTKGADFIHLFLKTHIELTETFKTYKSALLSNGMLWISWPKGASKLKTDLNRDLIRNYVLEHRLVDVKVAAIDDDWSGLKFVYRLKDRND